MTDIVWARRQSSLWEELIRLVQGAMDENLPCLVVVPQQYTLKCERDLIESLKLPGLLDINVLSPKRLYSRIREEAGAKEKIVIGSVGERAALSLALRESKDKLQYYRRATRMQGFVDACLEETKRLLDEGVSGESLIAAADKAADPAISAKMHDLGQISLAYQNILGDKLGDQAMQERDSLSRLGETSFIQNAVFILYGFDMLTPALVRLISAAAGQTDRVHLLIVCQGEEKTDGRAFAPVRRSLQKLYHELNEKGSPYGLRILKEEAPTAPASIQALEKGFLRLLPDESEAMDQGAIMHAAPTPFDECDRAAALVQKNIQNGQDPEKIAILCCELESYAPMLAARLEAHGAPYYLSQKRPLSGHGLARMLIASLKIITLGYLPQDMQLLLQSGYADLGDQEIFHLQNYIREKGVSYGQWKRPFKKGAPEEMETMEALRKKLVDPLETLAKALKPARPAKETLEALIFYMESLNAYDKLQEETDRLSALGFLEESNISGQVAAKIAQALEEIYKVAGERPLDANDLLSLVEGAFKEADILGLPQRPGQVEVGALGNVPLLGKETVIILGLNDGVLKEEESLIFDDREQADLAEALSIHQATSAKEKGQMKLLDLWKAMSAPQKELLLSYALQGDGGESRGPLYQLKRVQRILPNLPVLGGSASNLGLESAFEGALERLGSEDFSKEDESLLCAMLYDEKYRERVTAALLAAETEPDSEVAPDLVRRLLEMGRLSATQVESYYRCPMRYFIQYALKPQETREWDVDRRDWGIFYHQAMQEFTKRTDEISGWPDAQAADVDAVMDSVVDEMTLSWENTPMLDTPRAKAEVDRAKGTCRLLAGAVQAFMKDSAFETAYTEWAFGRAGGAPGPKTETSRGELSIEGVIDRIDTAQVEEQDYLRIIDYKSGSDTYQPTKIAAGVQLQMLLYLAAAREAFPGHKPAGFFYQFIKDEMQVEQEWQKATEMDAISNLKMQGAVLDDPKVVEAMDANNPPKSMAQVYKKEGDPTKSARILSPEDFDLLCDFALKKAKEAAEEIGAGKAKAQPYVFNRQDVGACAYCRYQGLCRLDPVTARDRRRWQKGISHQEMIQLLRGRKL